MTTLVIAYHVYRSADSSVGLGIESARSSRDDRYIAGHWRRG